MTLFEQFYNAQNGKGVDTDGFSYQCVSLFKWWLKYLGDPNWKRALGGDGYAHQIYYRFHENGYDQWFDLIWDDAQIGDVLVYGKTSSTPYSHVSFFMGDLPNGTQHYSWGQNQKVGDMRACTIPLPNSAIIAVLRPKNRAATNATVSTGSVASASKEVWDANGSVYVGSVIRDPDCGFSGIVAELDIKNNKGKVGDNWINLSHVEVKVK